MSGEAQPKELPVAQRATDLLMETEKRTSSLAETIAVFSTVCRQPNPPPETCGNEVQETWPVYFSIQRDTIARINMYLTVIEDYINRCEL